MVVIFVFSTDRFSGTHTSGIIEPLLRFLFPFLTQPQVVFWHGVFRKAGHITEYFVLGILAWRVFKLRLVAAGFVLAVALSDEFHQSFVSSRTASLMDVGYDFFGGLIALLILYALKNESRTVPTHTVL
jgi:VanZ family protein